MLEETPRYLHDVKRLVAERQTPQAHYEQMLELHPGRQNHGPLWYSGLALLGAAPAG
jgi:hypothetical protein